MAARRAALAAAPLSAPPGRPGRRDRRRAGAAGEDVTELDSIPAGRIDQGGPHGITVFPAGTFRALVVQAEGEGGLGGGLRQLVLGGEPADRGAGRQELGGVLAPDMVLDVDGDADDAGRTGLGG